MQFAQPKEKNKIKYMKINNKSNSVGKFTYKDTSKDYLICEICFFLVTNEIHTKRKP